MFSVSRVSHTDRLIHKLMQVHRENDTPLKEAHLKLFHRRELDETVIIPRFVSHLQCVNLSNSVSTRLPVGSIPNSVVDLGLQRFVPAIVSIPSSVKRLSMTICLIEFDPAVIPSTVTDLTLCLYAANENGEIRFMFPTSLKCLSLGGHTTPFAPGVLPSSLRELDCCSELLSKLEAGAIPDSVKKMKTALDIRYVPKAGVLSMVPGIIPDSVTHLTFDEYINRPITEGVIPQSVTHLVFGSRFNQTLSSRSLPSALTHLAFGYYFKQPIGSSVTHLTINRDSDQNLDHNTLPHSLTHLEIPPSYLNNGKLQLPSHVTHLSYEPILQQPEF